MTRLLEVLILDDEPEAAEMLSELLGLYFPDATIGVVHSGEGALSLGIERQRGVAIFDLEMAGLGGEGAARELRLLWPEVPLLMIALSGNVTKLDALRREGPFNHLLSNPVDMETLVKLLRSHVETEGSGLHCCSLGLDARARPIRCHLEVGL